MNSYKGAFLSKWPEGTADNLRNTVCDDVWHHLNLSSCLFFVLPSFAFHCVTFVTFFFPHSLSVFSYKLSWAGPPGPGNIIFSYNHEMKTTPSYELIILSCSSLFQESRHCWLKPSACLLLTYKHFPGQYSWEDALMMTLFLFPLFHLLTQRTAVLSWYSSQ